MAELDEKLLKTLDDRLKNMLTTMTSLDSVIQTVVTNSKSSLTDLISLFQASGASLTDMLQAFKGNRLADLLGIKDAAGQVKQLNEQIETLNRNTKMGGKASWVEDKDTGGGSWKVLKGDEFKNEKEERDAINALAEARQKLHDLTLSDAQLMEKIVSLINKAAVETQKEESAKEREFQKAVKQQEELARKYAEIEKLRADVFGDKPYGKLSGKEKMQWIEYEDSLKKIKAQMEEIEKSSTGSKAEGERIFKEQEAVAKAKLALAEKERREKEEAARQEKELNKAIAEEARRKKEDENEYLRLLKERNKLLEQNARLAENRRNAGLTGYIDTSNYFGSQQDKNDARLRQLNDEIQLYEESVKLTADGQRKKEEMELAHENRMTEIKVQGEQKREQILDRESNKKKSKAERDAKTEEAIQKQADSLVKRRISLTNEISRIDNNRAIRQKTNTNITQQALDAEEKKYQALKAMVDQLTASLAELEKKQSGVTAKAEAKNAPYQQYTQAKEEERVNAELEKRNKILKDNKRTMDSMLPTLQRLASAFGVAFSVRGLAQFGKKLIETRGEFELQQVALRSILQNKQLADEIWDKTMQAALQSPFTAMQLTKYTKQLAAYRIYTDKLFDTTKRLADVSAGLGVDMQRLILAYGQVKAANYLRASEIRQFTEAGVNILGELSQYFTETREGMYDTAKVMDMVTKRMVKFEDVEAIFKRMTDQGGIFYEMQYVQSQTVKGQINKLRDAYDQMQNSIGKANEGVLKDMVSLLNSIVKNWRTWAVVLKSIAWGAVIGYLSKFALPLMGIGKASVSTLRSIVRLRQGVQSLGASLKANLPMLGIFAATAVISALNNLRKKMNEVNKEIDEQNLRLYETRQNFEGMKSKIEENNRILKTAGSKTEDLNKAQKENESIMQRLRNEYPQLADQMQIATNGIIDMNDALDANIRKLNEQMTVLNAMKQGNWFSDSDQKNLADWQGALATMKTTLIAAQSEARKKVMQMELGGETDEPLYDIYKKVADIDLSGNILDAVSAFNLLNGEVRAYQSNLYKGTPTRSESLYSILGIKVGNLQANWSENRVKDVLGRLAPTLQSYYENGIKDNADFIKEINEQYDDNVTKFIQANAEKINQATLDGLNNANSILINTLKPQTAEMKTFLNQELNRLFGTTGIDYFSTSTKGTTPTTADTEGDKQSKIDAAWRRRINLIEEMKKRYDELSKSAFGYAKSEDSVRKAFDDSFGEIFKGTGINMNQIDFTSMSGMMESMKVLLEKAKGVSDSVREELMKKIDSFEAQITIDAQVRIREDFGKQMEKMFNNYELTIDLEKLNVPTDELVGIFNLDVTTLDELRRFVDDFYNKQIELGNNPTELVEQVEGYYKKIDEMEKKELRERLKTYSKYLAEGQVEALKIHLEELKKMAELDKLYEQGYFTDTQYKDISNKIRKETDEKLAKNDWQQFKESDFYVTMFEDMSRVSSESIDVMIKRLRSLRKSVNDLNPKQAKEIVKAIEKLEKTKLERSPLKSFLDDWKAAAKWRKENDTLVKQLGFYASGEEYWSKEQDKQSKKVAELRLEYEELVKNGTPEDAADVKKRLDFEEEELSKINEILEDRRQKLDEINQKQNEGYAAQQRVLEGLAKGAQYFSDLASTAGTISTEIMDMFDGVSDATKKYAKDIAEIATNAGMLAADIAKAIASEGTDVGSMIDGIVRTWNIIKGALSASEAENNRTIEKNTDLIEDLEWKLERLRKAREKAWDTTTIRNAEAEIEGNLRDQIQAYDGLIAAEEDRKSKDSDLIKQWKQEREELQEELEEEREEFYKTFGGIGENGYLDAAQGFVDAWKSAFLETGDGLQGLQDHFDEFLNEWFVKQATMRIAGKTLEPLFRDIDAAVDKYGDGGTSVMMSELAKVRERFGIIAPELSDALEELTSLWGLGGEGSLSGLAAGIQGMTEEQANILEAYWNSVRGFTANIDMNVSRIAQILGAGGDSTNPQLQQLTLIAANTQATHQLLQSVTKSGHSQGGYGIKVFAD